MGQGGRAEMNGPGKKKMSGLDEYKKRKNPPKKKVKTNSGLTSDDVWYIKTSYPEIIRISTPDVSWEDVPVRVRNDEEESYNLALVYFRSALSHAYAKYDKDKLEAALRGIFEWAKEGGLK